MELTINHLAAYLPYKLHLAYKAKPSQYYEVFGILQGISGVQFKSAVMDFVNVKDYFAPVLKPMSQLTRKELEGAGFDTTSYAITRLLRSVSGNDRFKIELVHSPYYLVQYLLSQHYDIFGLIEAGLAVEK